MTIVPTPVSIELSASEFVFPNPLPISGAGRGRDLLTERLSVAAGWCCVDAGETRDAAVTIVADDTLADEEYRLDIDDSGVRIWAGEGGDIWAVQTLLQLLPHHIYARGPFDPATMRVPHARITDKPAYRWRGSHVDVARHFLSFDGLLNHLEIMSMHKLNVLHLHLTDDQGWRIPIAGYPRLIEVGSVRPGTLRGRQAWDDEPAGDALDTHDGRPHGGYYTLDQLRELNQRATQLGITVVPEIDMPGHMEAAIAAYPELGAASLDHPRTCFGVSEHVLRLSDEVVDFCRAVLDTVMDIFPGSPIHVGGDEVPGNEWLSDPVSQATMRAIGATTPAEGQAWFERQVCEHVLARGRRVIAWDEVLDGGVPPEVTVMVWCDAAAISRAAHLGHDVIAAPESVTYFDHGQADGQWEPLTFRGTTTLADTAGFAQVLATEGLIGGQFQLWSEYVHDWARAEYLMWPRGCAIADQLWSGRTTDAVTLQALTPHLRRLTAAGVRWCRPDYL